jgi:hypothetical protein
MYLIPPMPSISATGQGSGAIMFENVTLVEMTLQVKAVADGGGSEGEFL